MEFTYRISEQEFLQAAKLYRKSNAKIRKILFVTFVFLCLVLLFAVVMKIRDNPVENISQEPAHVTVGQIIQQTGPLVLMGALWIVLIFIWPRMRLRGIYRKSAVLQGEMTVQATLDAFSVQTSTGSASRTAWRDMKSWHEGNGLMVLIYPTKVYQIVSLIGLSGPQREELRAILASALPRQR